MRRVYACGGYLRAHTSGKRETSVNGRVHVLRYLSSLSPLALSHKHTLAHAFTATVVQWINRKAQDLLTTEER